MIWSFKRKQALPSAEDCPVGSIARDAWDTAEDWNRSLRYESDGVGLQERLCTCAIQWANARDMPFEDLRNLTARNLWMATREFARGRRR